MNCFTKLNECQIVGAPTNVLLPARYVIPFHPDIAIIITFSFIMLTISCDITLNTHNFIYAVFPVTRECILIVRVQKDSKTDFILFLLPSYFEITKEIISSTTSNSDISLKNKMENLKSWIARKDCA